MIVRKIRREEFRRTQQFCALAFEYQVPSPDFTAEQAVAQVAEHPQSTENLHWDQWWAAFEDDDRTMMSTFIAIPFRANFDGHDVGMIGIGGVSTLPQYRRQGGIRACFEKALPDMYAQGAALSYLYPFSTSFYRKFGYELGCERDLWKLKLSGLPRFEVEGSFHLLEKGSDLKKEIQQVYDVFASRYNCMTLDPEIEYSWVEKADPFRDKVYTYVYRSKDGTPKGVVTYKPVVDEGNRTLDCTSRFLFADGEGLRALLHLLCRLQADHSHILISLPTDVKLDSLLKEWSFGNQQRRRYCHGMVRVVNALEVLKLARMRGTGELTIELRDEQIAENNGCFYVRFENGKTTSVERTQAQPDVSLSIQEFSRLICGKHDIEDLQWLEDVRLFCEPEKAARVFYRKPMFITLPF